MCLQVGDDPVPQAGPGRVQHIGRQCKIGLHDHVAGEYRRFGELAAFQDADLFTCHLEFAG